jgi:serine/threonine-protein kinase mTOR
VRLCVLKSLPSCFDRYIARAHHVDILLLILADEIFDIRMSAMFLIGRLAQTNPAAVLPPLRLHLMRLVAAMRASPKKRGIEEATLMLCNFLRFEAFHEMVRPVMTTVITTLPVNSDVRTVTAALQALGELSVVLKHDITRYGDDVSNSSSSSSL